MNKPKIIFNYIQQKIEIQCKENEILKDICSKYAIKIQKDLNSLYFLYSGKKLTETDLNLPFKKVINKIDYNNNCFELLVFDINEENNNKDNKDNFDKANQPICPKCREIASIEIQNYKLKISCKKCGINNLLISEFEQSQMIDISKIIYNKCKNSNKSNSYDKIFYKSNTCKNNICSLCKTTHDKNNIIINYDEINYICEKHSGPYNSYCKICNKNFCTDCEKEHNDHETTTYGKILPDKDELRNNLKEQQKILDNFSSEIMGIIKKLENIRNNMQILFKFNENMINNYIKLNAKRNYEMIININNCNSYINNNIFKEINQIINNKNESNKILKLLNIYDKMNSLKEINGIEFQDKEIIKLKDEIKQPEIKNENLETEKTSNKNIISDLNNKLTTLNNSKPLFTIRSACNINKCISTKSSNYGENAVIWDYQPNNTNQIFELEKGNKEGYYYIKNHYSGYYFGIDIREWKTSLKRKDENNQNFKLIESKIGFYTFLEKLDLVVETGNWITDNGHLITPMPKPRNVEKNENNAQLWKLVFL